MRVTYRRANNKDYWTKRWADIPADQPMQNRDVYPLKYAELTLEDKHRPILEAGCGAGRILRYYHQRGYDIVGIDFIEVAVHKLKEIDPTLRVEVGDITQLRFPDRSFGYVLAFGLFHNLEHGLEKAVAETRRVLDKNGLVCASFRADNIQTRLTDWLADRRSRNAGAAARSFHKLNLTRSEYEQLFARAGFTVQDVYPVENMPILYKFASLRAREHKAFDENKARKEGYRLSWLGQRLQNFLMRIAPDQFCNIYVLIARRAD
ncbi:MAG TPA: class I SAM-dependent methyltransferase [Burkholderiales bacterium]|nr:class I SAM-dependent methyltransferase [Burkholderiales bacterium]